MKAGLNEGVKDLIISEVEKHPQGIYAFELKESENCKGIKRSTFYWYLHRLSGAGDLTIAPIGGSEIRPHTMLIFSKK
jgi:hypothetical protein